MRAENRHGVLGNFRERLDEHRALCPQAVDDMFVVHDLVADIDRRAVFLQRALDDLDGAHDAGTETARLREDDAHGNLGQQLKSA